MGGLHSARPGSSEYGSFGMTRMLGVFPTYTISVLHRSTGIGVEERSKSGPLNAKNCEGRTIQQHRLLHCRIALLLLHTDPAYEGSGQNRRGTSEYGTGICPRPAWDDCNLSFRVLRKLPYSERPLPRDSSVWARRGILAARPRAYH